MDSSNTLIFKLPYLKQVTHIYNLCIKTRMSHICWGVTVFVEEGFRESFPCGECVGLSFCNHSRALSFNKKGKSLSRIASSNTPFSLIVSHFTRNLAKMDIRVVWRMFAELIPFYKGDKSWVKLQVVCPSREVYYGWSDTWWLCIA